MSGYEPSQTFHDAAAFLSNAPSLSGLSNTAKLELYGLFKVITVDAIPTTSRPSIFDFAGRAKWDAWKETGQKYTDRRQAEERYISLAQQLGWQEGASVTDEASADASSSQDKEDNDSEATQSKGSSGGGGMGVRVSTMEFSDESHRTGSIIHGFAIAGNEESLREYLDANESVDVNEVDENGYTPLHLACDRGHAAVTKLLLDRGADPSIKDSDDYTALELAEIAEHDEVVDIIKAATV